MFPRCLRACSLLDAFLVDSAVTSLAFSPTSDFLVTTHVDDLGVYLWSNMTLYEHVALRPLPADYEPQLTIAMPSSSRATQGITSPVTSRRHVVTVTLHNYVVHLPCGDDVVMTSQAKDRLTTTKRR